MQVKNTRTKFFDTFRKLQTLSTMHGFKLVYGIMRIKNLLESEVKAAQQKSEELARPTEAFLAYDRKRIELLEQYCEHDPKTGKPVIVSNEYQVAPEKREEYEAALLPLKAENQALVDERKAQMKQIDAYLEEEITLDFYALRAEWLPDTITVEQLEILAPFVCNLEDEPAA